ncbi:M14 family metallopeptidase [Sphingobacterium sp. lm-10]|uniref:M14 family metallopeptidase n=1 Tax=Sphingobacterium sp. lm-10 TaxID=2944904 RepID=UPI00202052F4|nr:M14 family metallopeptidase [Sphingobacterium sp. lm-10]MCL7988935.1 M14 family metallopeptidase [Sphingobacterium sp. lm-10]
MNRIIFLYLGILSVCSITAQAQVQTDYSNKQQLAQRVKALAARYPQLVKATSLTKTLSGSDIWMLSIGSGALEQKPAVAIVGGVAGDHLLGVELAVGFAEKLLANASQDSIRQLLNQQTFYVFPNMSPDATEQYFAKLQYERTGNARPLDYDRDGRKGEDGYDDLDGDGKITWLRVEDPTGTYLPNPKDPRSMVLADPAKNQRGQYRLLSEGVDNDKDGLFNEDGDEGVAFNKNNTYNYKNFLPGAGEHAVSELENRALYDFLYDAFNVYAVVSFGPENNLSTPQQAGRGVEAAPSSGSRRPGGRMINSWSEADANVNASVSSIYNKLIQLGEAPKQKAGNGNFADWAYYHYGRLSFSTPGWWVPDTEKDPVASYFTWADAQGISGNHTPWKAISHPDFPNKNVEVGGIHPFVLHNPPYKMVDSLVSKHTDFVIKLTGMAPMIDIVDVNTEKLDGGLTRISLKVINKGAFPTLTQVGERSYFLKHVVVELKAGNGQKVLSGKSRQTIGALEGHGYTELNWLIQGSGKLSIEAGNASSGKKSVNVSL